MFSDTDIKDWNMYHIIPCGTVSNGHGSVGR